MTDKHTDWPKRIKKLLRDREWTHRELAERLGMDVLTGMVLISRWKNGVNLPDRRYQDAIAELEREG